MIPPGYSYTDCAFDAVCAVASSKPAWRYAWQQASKLARKNANQRNRRAKKRRIDYYVSAEALAIINAQCQPQAGHDTSSVINRLRQPVFMLIGDYVAV